MSNKTFGDGDRKPKFAKSSFSDGAGDCVEVAVFDGWVAVRDSKDLFSPVLWFTPSEWKAFIAGVRAGEFDFGE
ncbi:DUF397 domain-containing protein [Nocardia goodfellowii]|uniref:ABC-type amino acid transport substrate-binding protein n=1 Tax=Nocardia goodfellowii TaxID=882446 RepID=A0ABS4QH36_9NOCA|nr:DUF397 domain-containing protein [Nocardia goodfellowii]MBP2191011.1 ABC-type amino acid transport substrate-binding protein [Nocardia goodfellowii]